MPNQTYRKVDSSFVKENRYTSFSDGYPILIIGQESLNFLNNKLAQKISINRFRPNIVFTGGGAFDEDNFKNFKIQNTLFEGVKPCGRCNIITIDQLTAETSAEPLKTLSSFRTINNKVLFGKNAVVKEFGGEIKIGNTIFIS